MLTADAKVTYCGRDKRMREVYGTIRRLGATSKYKGYYFVAEAIHMTMEFQERPMKITKDIYPKLAKKFKSKRYSDYRKCMLGKSQRTTGEDCRISSGIQTDKQ